MPASRAFVVFIYEPQIDDLTARAAGALTFKELKDKVVFRQRPAASRAGMPQVNVPLVDDLAAVRAKCLAAIQGGHGLSSMVIAKKRFMQRSKKANLFGEEIGFFRPKKLLGKSLFHLCYLPLICLRKANGLNLAPIPWGRLPAAIGSVPLASSTLDNLFVVNV